MCNVEGVLLKFEAISCAVEVLPSHSLSNPEPIEMRHCLFVLSLAQLFAWFKYQHPFNRLSYFIISPVRYPQLFQVIKVEAVFCNGERFGFKSPPFLINYSSFSNLCLGKS